MLSLTVCIRALFSVQYQEKCVVHQQGFKQTLLSVLRFWRFVVEGEGGLGGGGGGVARGKSNLRNALLRGAIRRTLVVIVIAFFVCVFFFFHLCCLFFHIKY